MIHFNDLLILNNLFLNLGLTLIQILIIIAPLVKMFLFSI